MDGSTYGGRTCARHGCPKPPHPNSLFCSIECFGRGQSGLPTGGATCGCGQPTYNGEWGQKCRKSCTAGVRHGPIALCAYGSPTYNGKPDEKCSKSCIAIAECGCGKPTFNGQWGVRCSRSCTAQILMGPPAAAVPYPDSSRVNFQLAQALPIIGEQISVVGFYFPDRRTPCDELCKSWFLGNFFELGLDGLSIQSPTYGTIHKFRNAEAAFQALKFWPCADLFRSLTGTEAFDLKRRLGTPDLTYGGFGSNWNAMLYVLRQKFAKGTQCGESLLQTGDAFLLEHNDTIGRDAMWSDNSDGTGSNWLGFQLMIVRGELRERPGDMCRWSAWLRDQLDMSSGQPLRKDTDSWHRLVLRANQTLRGTLNGSVPSKSRLAFQATKADRTSSSPSLVGSLDTTAIDEGKPEQPPPSASTILPRQQASGLLTCTACGKHVCQSSDSFCPQCGVPQAVSTAMELHQSQPTNIDEWLGSLKLGEYGGSLKSYGYKDLSFLTGATRAEVDSALKEVGMKVPHCRVFLEAWELLAEQEKYQKQHQEQSGYIVAPEFLTALLNRDEKPFQCKQ